MFNRVGALIRYSVFLVDFSLGLHLLSALVSFCLFNFLGSSDGLITPRGIIVGLFFSFLFGEVYHLLLLLHNFIQPFNLQLLLRAVSFSFAEHFDLLDALVVVLGLQLHVLILPVAGAVGAYLQLNLECV